MSEPEWFAGQLDAITDVQDVVTPSQWAERNRYLPPSLTSMPGFYRFEIAPYLREIVDCMSVDSPVRECAVMKGVQICATVGLIENTIGYLIAQVRTSAAIFFTADADLAKQRLESNVTPMLQHSGLSHLIQSADVASNRKAGKTDKKIEWFGGGFLLPMGARSPSNFRSNSAPYILRDEIDAWPDVVGKDGDPIKLSGDRAAAYESSRKVLDLSTPLIKGQSKIAKRFKRGDQRRYHVCCLGCGAAQVLRWRTTNNETGEVSGIVWETNEGRLVPGSVRYVCPHCGHAHTNDDKTRLLSPDNGAEWRPTATPVAPDVRSYHISALYSPVGMQTWDACVIGWLDAWDEENNRPKDMGKLQIFYNNTLGEPFEMRGEKVRFETISEHRRTDYLLGEIPNDLATRAMGGEVQLLTCAVDVHASHLDVAVFGWTAERRALLIDYWVFEGDTDALDDPGTWGRLREVVEDREYIATDGKEYRIQMTLIDAGYRTDHVYRFCGQYSAGVFPCKGRTAPPKSAAVREFSGYQTPMGTTAYGITVDIYKDRWASALRRSWNGEDMQPPGHFNAPLDTTDGALRELTVETKREKVEPVTGRRLGFVWHRPSGARNELWDLLIYNSAALDMIGWEVCVKKFEREFVNWPEFFKWSAETQAYFTDPHAKPGD